MPVKMRFQPEKHFSVKMKIFKNSNVCIKLNLLMSYFQSKSYNCTAAQLLNPFRTHFKEFQFSTTLLGIVIKEGW